MRKFRGWKTNVVMLMTLLLLVTPVLAQEAATTEAEAPGFESLLLLLGVLALLIVGGVIYIRERLGEGDTGDV